MSWSLLAYCTMTQLTDIEVLFQGQQHLLEVIAILLCTCAWRNPCQAGWHIGRACHILPSVSDEDLSFCFG